MPIGIEVRCDMCGTFLPSKAQWKKHCQTMHQVPVLVRCHGCQQEFSPSNYNAHKLAEAAGVQRGDPHACRPYLKIIEWP